MDQGQSPQTQTKQPPKLYGVDTGFFSTNTPIWQKMAKRFAPQDFVRVMNIDDETFYWQALDPRKETEQQIGGRYGAQKITHREDPEIFSLAGGATAVLEGWNAYIMIEKLFKQVIAKKTMVDPKYRNQKVKAFSWNNDNLQEEYIDKIFLGKETPTFGGMVTERKPVEVVGGKVGESPVVETNKVLSVKELAEELGIDGSEEES